MNNKSNRLHQSPSKQSGYSAAGIIFALLLATLLFKVAYVVAPAYYDNYLVVEGLEALAERHPDDLKDIRKSEVRSELSKYYSLNGVRNGVITSALEVERLKERTIIKVDYEIRTNFLANADIVLSFKNHLDSSKPDECCTPSEKN